MIARTTAIVSFAIFFIFGVGCSWRGAVAGCGSWGGCVDNGSSCGVVLKLSNRFFGALAGARFFFGFRPRLLGIGKQWVGTEHVGRSPETIGSTCRNTATPDCCSGSFRSCVHEHADASHALALLRARRERPRGSRAAECSQQFPPSDGDCHAPSRAMVRKCNDTTPRACSLHGHRHQPRYRDRAPAICRLPARGVWTARWAPATAHCAFAIFAERDLWNIARGASISPA